MSRRHAFGPSGRQSLYSIVREQWAEALVPLVRFSEEDRGAPKNLGGAERDRTDDLRLAKPALSQLSYGPNKVGQGRVELPTSRLSGVRSNHLSYWPSVAGPE